MNKRPPDPQGKVALFSGQPRSDGAFQLECGACGSHTRVGLPRLLQLALPVSFSVPFRYHHTWMKCPACERRAWIRIRPFG